MFEGKQDRTLSDEEHAEEIRFYMFVMYYADDAIAQRHTLTRHALPARLSPPPPKSIQSS